MQEFCPFVLLAYSLAKIFIFNTLQTFNLLKPFK
uniref:Uncharacterized protein n=1 Tax=Rhizophora mucronata TaxID=61149 RepID=A0A2P2NWD0_RHIMU